jgi:hypothetical protein
LVEPFGGVFNHGPFAHVIFGIFSCHELAQIFWQKLFVGWHEQALCFQAFEFPVKFVAIHVGLFERVPFDFFQKQGSQLDIVWVGFGHLGKV